MLLDINKGIAGQVFATGQARISNNPQTDTRWNPKVDKQLAFRTENLLCLPLKYGDTTMGVVQFLNKPDGFSEQDKHKIDKAIAILAYKVAQFVQHVDNFEILGLAYSQEADDGSVMYIDMSASSSLLRGAHPIPRTDVVNLVNEYLDKLSKVAIAHGCIVDKFMWDGCLLSLNVAEPVPYHRKAAFRAALAMNQEFREIKESWLRGDYPVEQLFLRVSIASGPVIQVDMGPAQYRQKTIVGDPVVVASALCANAPRNRNVIVVEQSVYNALPSHSMKSYKVPQAEMGKARGLITGAYRLEMADNSQNE
jgi:class 3 adenylate cyclase